MRRGGVLLAVAFVILVALLAVFVATRHDGHSATPPAAAPPTPGAPTRAATAGAGCATTDTSQTVPTTAPPGVTWTLFQTVALPFSTTAGPARVAGDVASYYAHTPTGALLAASQIGVRYLLAHDWRSVSAAQVAPGVGRDAFAKLRAQANGEDDPPGAYGQYAGFKFVTYTPQTAVIELVSRFANGNLQMVTSSVVWYDGDWRLRLQDNGSVSPTAQRLDSVAGFAPWGGV